MAVLGEIKKSYGSAQIRFWCDYKFASQARSIINNFDKNIPVQVIIAGKLRRYNHLSFFKQLLVPHLVILNIRDIFLTFIGIFQSFIKLIFWRPDVVFAKGGFVCLPVGFAAHILRIPLVIHDSDAHPGLTNRILGMWANSIATGAPLKYYSYPTEKAIYTGIPISDEFKEFSKSDIHEAKLKWGIDPSRPLIVVTGGGLGAQQINSATVFEINNLLRLGSVILISGVGQYKELRSQVPKNSEKFQMHAFIAKDIASLLGAATVVIARAGATTILELAALVKPTILIPNGKLTGGHQLKNAAVYAEHDAIKIINEEDMVNNPHVLFETVRDILHNPVASRDMAVRFSTFVHPNAARDVADMVISSIK